MSQTFFRFKEFTVHQENCALKVCTEACLFGAWVASLLPEMGATKNMLDIGAGTGLLSLLLAQKSEAHMDAIEIDEDAAAQAADNFGHSPWGERLTLLPGDARQFDAEKKYGLIISNPPFFENNLKGPDEKRNLALHNDALTLEDLATVVQRCLAPNGYFAVLLPPERTAQLESLTEEYGWQLMYKTAVRQTPAHPVFRYMLIFSGAPKIVETNEIIIREENGNYTETFIALLKDYYLHL